MRVKLLCTALLFAAVLTPVVSAQETANATATASPTATPSPTPTATPTATPAQGNATPEPVTEVNIGPLTKVTAWEYSAGSFIIEIEAKAPTLLTIAESPAPSAGDSGTISYVRQSLSSGTNQVTVAVEPSGGEAIVVLSTPGSVNQGTAAFLRADTSDELLDGPPSEDDVRDAAFGTGLGTGLGALIVIVRRRFGLHRGMERVA